MWRRVFAACVVAGSIGSFSFGTSMAQDGAVQVMGVIQSVEGTRITAENADGSVVTFRASGRIVSNQPIEVDFIEPGLSVALTTTMRGGELVVTHLHTQPWARAPGTFATRPLASDASYTRHLGRITAVAPADDGVHMTFLHEGDIDETTVFVPANLEILYHNRVEDEGVLRPGVMVVANATPGDDGQLASGFVTVEVDGANPIQNPD